MTWVTWGMSRPRAATSVATSTRHLPVRKARSACAGRGARGGGRRGAGVGAGRGSARRGRGQRGPAAGGAAGESAAGNCSQAAQRSGMRRGGAGRGGRRTASRSAWLLSPWMLVAGTPLRISQSSSWSAPRLVSTNTRVRPCAGGGGARAGGVSGQTRPRSARCSALSQTGAALAPAQQHQNQSQHSPSTAPAQPPHSRSTAPRTQAPPRAHLDAVDQVDDRLALGVRLHVLDVLHDQVGGGADAADGEEDVVGEEVGGEALDLLGEGGREEQRLALPGGRHVLLLHDAADLRLEAHVQHAVGLRGGGAAGG
jgi:hypothetical protein